MDIPAVLNVARTFIFLQLNGDVNTIKFLGASYGGGTWTVKCVFKDKEANLGYVTILHIYDLTGQVTSFTSEPISSR